MSLQDTVNFTLGDQLRSAYAAFSATPTADRLTALQAAGSALVAYKTNPAAVTAQVMDVPVNQYVAAINAAAAPARSASAPAASGATVAASH